MVSALGGDGGAVWGGSERDGVVGRGEGCSTAFSVGGLVRALGGRSLSEISSWLKAAGGPSGARREGGGMVELQARRVSRYVAAGLGVSCPASDEIGVDDTGVGT